MTANSLPACGIITVHVLKFALSCPSAGGQCSHGVEWSNARGQGTQGGECQVCTGDHSPRSHQPIYCNSATADATAATCSDAVVYLGCTGQAPVLYCCAWPSKLPRPCRPGNQVRCCNLSELSNIFIVLTELHCIHVLEQQEQEQRAVQQGSIWSCPSDLDSNDSVSITVGAEGALFMNAGGSTQGTCQNKSECTHCNHVR